MINDSSELADVYVGGGVRVTGEGGMLDAWAAITNAIEDALASRGVTITEQLPPSGILESVGVIQPD